MSWSDPMGGRASAFHRIYVRVAGRHPDLRPWHFQWLDGLPRSRALRPILEEVRGSVLDVGCGYKPYRAWMPHSTRHFGIDVFPGREVDALIEPNRPWPVEDGEFDVVLCTQVLEHVVDLELTLREITRTLKPGGHLIVTTPFIFGEHNSPDDYRRLSQHELRRVVDERFEIVELRTLGGIGSTLGALFLGWTYDALPTGRVERWAIAPLLPLWLALCLLVNALGLILSTADRTGLYYGNLLVHARHRGAD